MVSVFSPDFQKIFIHNTSLLKNGFRDAKLKLELVRQKDDESLNGAEINDDGTLEIIGTNYDAIKQFMMT